MKDLFKKYIFSFLWIVFAILTAFCIDNNINLESIRKYIGIISIGLFSWATLGRLGFNERSWDGVIFKEKIDKNLFWIQYFLGTVAGVLAML